MALKVNIKAVRITMADISFAISCRVLLKSEINFNYLMPCWTEFNSKLRENPTDVDLWIEFIDFQVQFSTGHDVPLKLLIFLYCFRVKHSFPIGNGYSDQKTTVNIGLFLKNY